MNALGFLRAANTHFVGNLGGGGVLFGAVWSTVTAIVDAHFAGQPHPPAFATVLDTVQKIAVLPAMTTGGALAYVGRPKSVPGGPGPAAAQGGHSSGAAPA